MGHPWATHAKLWHLVKVFLKHNQSIANEFFFLKIPEINLGRFSFRFSFGVIVAIHEK
jgi:hypothetical protein